MMMIVKNRKGISTFIATLLLMVLAVAAGVVIYAYTMGYLGGFGSPNTMGSMSLDTASMTAGSAPVVTAYLRNIGKVDLTPTTAYVDGAQIADADLDATTIVQNEVGVVTITSNVAVTAGTTHNIKIICEDNTQISFDVKATAVPTGP